MFIQRNMTKDVQLAQALVSRETSASADKIKKYAHSVSPRSSEDSMRVLHLHFPYPALSSSFASCYTAMHHFQPCTTKIQLLFIYTRILKQLLQNNAPFLLETLG